MIQGNRFSKSVLFFMKFMMQDKKVLFFILLLNIAAMVFNIVEPLLAKQIVDISFSLRNLEELIIPAGVWSGIYLIRYFVLYLSRKYSLKYNLNVYRKIRLFLFSNILKKRISFFRENSPSYIVSRCNSDIANLDGMLLSSLLAGLLAAVQILVMIALMIKINIFLTCIVILLECVILYIQFAFPLKKLYREYNEASAEMDKKVQDTFDCIKLIKAANSNFKEEKYYQNILEKYTKKRYSRDYFNIIRTIVTGFSLNFIYPAIVITGGIFIYYSLITVGSIMIYIMYFQKINALFNEAFALIPLYKIARISADRLYEIIKIPNEDISFDKSSRKIEINQPIVLENLNFAYGDKKILNDFSLKIYPHKINAVIGVSGAGKSTLVNLLMGFIKADSGNIYINGKNINAYKINDIRSTFALLSQESILLQRTVRENILYHVDERLVSDAKIKEILQKAKAEDFVGNLPEKMNYMVAGSGSNFSGGERQRLCLARELLKDAEVYIFDEATSSLDNLSEQVILQTIKDLARTKTVIMITHKLENTKIADVINLMDNGRICESGSYDELMRKKGRYYALMNNRF